MDGVPDAADVPYTGAQVTTNLAGTRTVQFNTTTGTDERRFTIKVVDPADISVYDTVMVGVERGAITLAASGTGVYYLGEEIVLSGTNTDNTTTYLFLTGPNIAYGGVRLDDVTVATTDGSDATFIRVGVVE